MKIIFILVIAFFSFNSFADQSYRQEWFVCQSSKDCMLIEDFCSWRAINKKFEKTFRETEDKRTNPYECIAARSDPETKKNYNVTCVKKLCQKTDKEK